MMFMPSLKKQLDSQAQEFLRSKHSVLDSYHALGRRIRRRLTRPSTLGFGFLAGFLLGASKTAKKKPAEKAVRVGSRISSEISAGTSDWLKKNLHLMYKLFLGWLSKSALSRMDQFFSTPKSAPEFPETEVITTRH